jgi:hypothetical protein
VVALLLAACLSGCSSTTFLYNRLDIILPWYLDRYVDLDREQSRAFDAQLEGLLEWHRREELERYAALLVDMEAELDGPLDLETIERYTVELESAWYRLRDRALSELLVLGAALSPAQIAEFAGALEKKQRKYERKYLDRDETEFRDDTYDNLRELHEDYLGRLEAPQRERLRLAADTLRRSDATWLRERAQWVGIITRELERAPGWQQRIRRIVKDWEAQLDPDTQRLYEHNTVTVQAAMVDVLNLRTPRQDERLRRKLTELREDFELLARQGL